MKTYFKSGTWNFICDVCGRKYKSDEGLRRWDGAMVCHQDYELRHPMDFLRGRKEKISVPWVRDEPADQYIVPGNPGSDHDINGHPIDSHVID